MNALPSLPTPDPLPLGPRYAIDRRWCEVANRWGARRVGGAFFAAISRLGDGVFWYALGML